MNKDETEAHFVTKRHLATVMVKRGTLQPGNLLVAGTALCKVKSMRNEHSKIIKSAGPSVPVEVGGWRTLPEAGDLVLEASDEALAKKVIESREALQDAKAQIASIQSLNETRSRDKLALEEAREQGLTPTQSAIQSLRKSVTTNGSEPIPVLPIILKADVHGSLEALTDALAGIPSHEARLQVIHSAVGPVHEADVDLAQSAGGISFFLNFREIIPEH